MGTRSIINIYKSDKRKPEENIVTIYRQYDGYPTGMGKDIKDVLNDGKVILRNGYRLGDNAPTHFNGMGCLSAFLIKQLKEDIGNVYLYPANTTDCGEEYVYNIYPNKVGKLSIEVQCSYTDKPLYKGVLSRFNPEKAEAKTNE